MTQRKSLARKLIVLFIVLVILIPCSVLVYDTVVSSNEERVDFYYMMSDGGMGALKKNIPRTDKEAMLKNVLAILQEGPNADGATASMPQKPGDTLCYAGASHCYGGFFRGIFTDE